MGKDHTLFALKKGNVLFAVKGAKRNRVISIIPAAVQA
jgi:large subunit ribosomal protein L27